MLWAALRQCARGLSSTAFGPISIQPSNTQNTDFSKTKMSRPSDRFDFSDRHAWPTSHLEQLLDAIDREIEVRETEEPLSLSRGLSEALQEFLESRNNSG